MKQVSEYIDISLPLYDGMMHWPNDPPVSVEVAKSPEKGNRSYVSFIKMGSHAGTHVDAPRHFLPKSYGVDEIPGDTLIGPCVVTDCRGAIAIGADEVDNIPQGAQRILFRTDNSDRMANGKFFEDFITLTPDAADALVGRGVKLVGVDAFSVDPYTARKPEVHLKLLSQGIAVLETLQLRDVPAGKYELICLPLRLEQRSRWRPSKSIAEAP